MQRSLSPFSLLHQFLCTSYSTRAWTNTRSPIYITTNEKTCRSITIPLNWKITGHWKYKNHHTRFHRPPSIVTEGLLPLLLPPSTPPFLYQISIRQTKVMLKLFPCITVLYLTSGGGHVFVEQSNWSSVITVFLRGDVRHAVRKRAREIIQSLRYRQTRLHIWLEIVLCPAPYLCNNFFSSCSGLYFPRILIYNFCCLRRL